MFPHHETDNDATFKLISGDLSSSAVLTITFPQAVASFAVSVHFD